MNLLPNSFQQMGKKSENGKNGYYGYRNNSVCGRCSYSSGCRINSQLAISTVTGSISPAYAKNQFDPLER